MKNRTMRKGFSLIELGIVMIVIGLIIAAVMKGKGMIESAENKKIVQVNYKEWVNTALLYYDKQGKNLDNESNITTELDSLGIQSPEVTFDFGDRKISVDLNGTKSIKFTNQTDEQADYVCSVINGNTDEDGPCITVDGTANDDNKSVVVETR